MGVPPPTRGLKESLAEKRKNRAGPSSLNTAKSTREKNGTVKNSKMADGTLLVSSL